MATAVGTWKGDEEVEHVHACTITRGARAKGCTRVRVCVNASDGVKWRLDASSAKPAAKAGKVPMTTLGCTEHRNYHATVGKARAPGVTRWWQGRGEGDGWRV
jgi:hypothetical protein